ncbi:MAG: hypothetical protein WDO06_08130 [Actinomycetota bacterium]
MTTASKVKFTVPALTTIVLKANSAIDKVSVKVGKIKVSEDYLTGYFHAQAAITSSDLLSVEFSVKSANTGKWSSVGVDTGAPYSVYLDPQDYSGQTVQIKAVATNSKGASFALPSATLTVPRIMMAVNFM